MTDVNTPVATATQAAANLVSALETALAAATATVTNLTAALAAANTAAAAVNPPAATPANPTQAT
jgi:hypothetical protein